MCVSTKYGTRNATDVMQVVEFTGLMKVYHEVALSLRQQSVKIGLDATCYLQTCYKLLLQIHA